jgi:hypothetical protein
MSEQPSTARATGRGLTTYGTVYGDTLDSSKCKKEKEKKQIKLKRLFARFCCAAVCSLSEFSVLGYQRSTPYGFSSPPARQRDCARVAHSGSLDPARRTGYRVRPPCA